MEIELEPVLNKSTHIIRKYPCITYCKKNGLIYLNQILMELLMIQDGDGIEVSQDKNNPIDWYIKAGGQLIIRKQKSGISQVSRKHHVNAFFSSLASLKIRTEKSVTFKVSHEITWVKDHQYYAILTKNPI